MAQPGKEYFSSRFGAIMALAGSAVGLGNIWRFPYLVGENGGAAFIVVYLVACVVLALPIFLAESIIGRRGGSSAAGSIRNLSGNSRTWKLFGLCTMVTPILILSYYSVVGGWSVDYLIRSVGLQFSGDIDTHAMFGDFISAPWEPLFMHTIFMVMTALIILFGVKNGIEKFSKITMPALMLLIIAVVVYGFTMPGAKAGIEYLLKPDFSKLTAKAVAAAMGQAFFSMSLGVGCILTYSSYVSKKDNLVRNGMATFVADFGFAMLAGFAVMPVVFAAGFSAAEGPGLVFETIPYIFSKMGADTPVISAVISILFFLALLMAALTSSISMLEIGVAYYCKDHKISRRRATILMTGVIWALGVLCTLSFGALADFKIFGLTVFSLFDAITANWLMPFGGMMFSMFVAYTMRREDVWDELTNGGTCNTRIFNIIYYSLKYIAPLGILVIFITNLIQI